MVELSDAPRAGARNRFLASFIGKLLYALLERLHTESIGQKVKGFGAGLDPTRRSGRFREQTALDCDVEASSLSPARAVWKQIKVSKLVHGAD